MSPDRPHIGQTRAMNRHRSWRPREDLAMKRFGLCAVVLLFAVSVSAAPACAQDKLIMGMGGGT